MDMSNKQFINWSKWAGILTVLSILAAFAAWGWEKAFSASLGNLPDKVQTHENLLQEHEVRLTEHDKRLTTLETSKAVDDVILSNSFANIERHFEWIQRHMTNNPYGY